MYYYKNNEFFFRIYTAMQLENSTKVNKQHTYSGWIRVFFSSRERERERGRE